MKVTVRIEPEDFTDLSTCDRLRVRGFRPPCGFDALKH